MRFTDELEDYTLTDAINIGQQQVVRLLGQFIEVPLKYQVVHRNDLLVRPTLPSTKQFIQKTDVHAQRCLCRAGRVGSGRGAAGAGSNINGRSVMRSQ